MAHKDLATAVEEILLSFQPDILDFIKKRK